MRQQHAHGDLLATRIVGLEFGHHRGHGQVEIQKAALVKDHGHTGGGDDLGEGSEIKDAGDGGLGSIRLVDETTEGFQSDEVSAMRDGDRGCGKSALGDGGV